MPIYTGYSAQDQLGDIVDESVCFYAPTANQLRITPRRRGAT